MKYKELLLNNDYWQKSFNRLISKEHISHEAIDELTKLVSYEKESIVDDLVTGRYNWDIPRKLLISKHGTTKKRTVYIYSYKDRLVQGVLYRVLGDIYSNEVSNLCYSYKSSVTTTTAVKFLRDNRTVESQGVKIDIHAYFNSVSIERLREIYDDLFKNSDLAETMKVLLFRNKVVYRNKVEDEYMGLIPGSPISSFFANYCLKDCDKYFEERGILYARYSDDIVILADSKDKLKEYLNVIKSYLDKYKLEINPDKYMWFDAGDSVDFLGLKLRSDGKIDLSDHSVKKLKKQIHRWCKKGRVIMERDKVPFEVEAEKVFKMLNSKNFKCYIKNESTFGWCHYAFRHITTIDSLIVLDQYTKDTIRAMYTGKHNKANARHLQNGELEELGYVSLVELYKLYIKDFDYYCEVIELI